MYKEEKLLTRNEVAKRWAIAPRTVDRMRQQGELTWLDLAGSESRRPIVRFRMADIIAFESDHLMKIKDGEVQNESKY